MRSIWKGAISFGLVSIPVGLYSATENRAPKFKMLRESDGSPIRYRRVAEADGKEVEWADIVRGYAVEKGRYVLFSDEELDSATAKGGTKVVDVVQFVDQSEIDPIHYRSSYYLGPDTAGAKAYQILHDALVASGRVGLATVALRDKQYMATLRPRDGVLVLETMYWPDEIRRASFDSLDEQLEIRDDEVAMAEMIIDNLSADFDPSQWSDKSRLAIEELVQKKVAGEEIVAPSMPEPTKVIDLMEALKASVEATKAKRAAG
jgi:DNA end-binding protein Ku